MGWLLSKVLEFFENFFKLLWEGSQLPREGRNTVQRYIEKPYLLRSISFARILDNSAEKSRQTLRNLLEKRRHRYFSTLSKFELIWCL